MKRLFFIIIFISISFLIKAQYKGLWFEASQYYKLGDSTVTVIGKDTLASPSMVRQYIATALINPVGYADSASYSDTSGYSIISDHANTSIYSDTSSYSDAVNLIFKEGLTQDGDTVILGGTIIKDLDIYSANGNYFYYYTENPINSTNAEFYIDTTTIYWSMYSGISTNYAGLSSERSAEYFYNILSLNQTSIDYSISQDSTGLYFNATAPSSTLLTTNHFLTKGNADGLYGPSLSDSVRNTYEGTDSIMTQKLIADTIVSDVQIIGDYTARIYDDGDTTRFESDNPIKIGNSSLVVNTDGSTEIDGGLNINGDVSIGNQSVFNYFATGIKSGFTISINADNTKIDIASGVGSIIDNTTPSAPVATPINYPGAIAVVLTNLATANATYLGVDISGTIIQQTSPFTPTQRREYLILGVAIHSNRTNVNAVNNLPDISLESIAQLNDFFDALKNFNIEGNVFSANGANLNINKSEGKIFKKGVNFENDHSNPHTITLAALTAPTDIRYRLQDGTEYPNTAVIDPANYDNAGVLTSVGANNFSIQRITVFTSNLVRIQYGQAVYGTLAAATQAIQSEIFVTEQNIAENGLLRGLLIVKGNATDLSNISVAQFFEADKFGSTRFSASGAPTTTLQQAYDNSVQPQIITSVLGQEVQIKRGTAADTDTVFSILNGADGTTYSILGNGVTSSSNPRFYASFSDSLEVITCTQNVSSHLTGTVGEIFTEYRNEGGFVFQFDSVQIPSVPGFYEMKYSMSFQGSASDVWVTDFFIDNVEINNRASRERSTSNVDVGSLSGFLDYYFTGGEWVKIMVKNTGDNDDMTIISCDWSIKYDE